MCIVLCSLWILLFLFRIQSFPILTLLYVDAAGLSLAMAFWRPYSVILFRINMGIQVQCRPFSSATSDKLFTAVFLPKITDVHMTSLSKIANQASGSHS